MGLKKVTEKLTVVYDSMNVRVVSGKIGSGKTTYVVNEALENVYKGRTVMLVNPESNLESDAKILSELEKLSKSSRFYLIKNPSTLNELMDIAVKLKVSHIVIDPLNLVAGAKCNMNGDSSPAIRELEKLASKYNVYVTCTLQEEMSF